MNNFRFKKNYRAANLWKTLSCSCWYLWSERLCFTNAKTFCCAIFESSEKLFPPFSFSPKGEPEVELIDKAKPKGSVSLAAGGNDGFCLPAYSSADFPSQCPQLQTCQAQLLLLQPQPQLQVLQLVLVSIWIIYFFSLHGGKNKQWEIYFPKRRTASFVSVWIASVALMKDYGITTILFFRLIVPPGCKAVVG